MIPMETATATAAQAIATPRREAMREQAMQLESFLFAELMRVSGTQSPSSGGPESQFESFLRQTHADAVASSGQTGLAEAIYRSMLRGAAG